MTLVRHIIDPATGQAIFVTPDDPTLVGLDGATGSLANLAGGGRFFAKFGPATTDWTEFAASSGFLPLSGGSLNPSASLSMSGTFTVNRGANDGLNAVRIQGNSGFYRGLSFQTGSSQRWNIYANNQVEDGTGAGSNLGISAYTDAGALIDTPVIIARIAGGSISLNRPTNVTGNLNVISGNATIQGGSIFAGTNALAAQAVVAINAASGQLRTLAFRTGGLNRWRWDVSTVAETGSNVGSNISLAAFDDAGTFVDSPIAITRAAGGTITLSRPTNFGFLVQFQNSVAFSARPTLGGVTFALTTDSYTAAASDAKYALQSVSVVGTRPYSLAAYDGSTDPTYGRTIDRPTSDYGRSLSLEFKTRASLGIPGSITYASVLTMAGYSDASSGITHSQLAQSGGVLSFRSGQWGSAWSAWNTILHSANFNSYAPTLTGTGATGNWNVNALNITSYPLNQAVDTASNPAFLGLSITNNWINFGAGGVNAPTATTRSAGTKLVLYGNVTSTTLDYAFGIEAGTLWASISSSTGFFKWYGGPSNPIATLSGSGIFQTYGAGSFVGFNDRTTGTQFGWYASGNTARFYNGTADAMFYVLSTNTWSVTGPFNGASDVNAGGNMTCVGAMRTGSAGGSGTLYFGNSGPYLTYNGAGLFTFSNSLTISGNTTMLGAASVQDNFYVNLGSANTGFGLGIIGHYDPTRYRLVYAMGSPYTMAGDGTTLAGFYGMYYGYDSTDTASGYKNMTGHSLGHGIGIHDAAVGILSYIANGMWTRGNSYANDFVLN